MRVNKVLPIFAEKLLKGCFINFENIVNSTRVKLPFGIAQLGKSFRNEITLGNSIFRTIEFDQAEIEYFFDPKKENWGKNI
ncbi:MAG: hypothetical protein KatS3mg035_2133 [Bacteroidia bacterium]|nr:MAG: hypothetical protein KatS3mg035_2133 [Bacteroidia bacterium]